VKKEVFRGRGILTHSFHVLRGAWRACHTVQQWWPFPSR
jgi:hypothetical protein